jgi:hypothetical protein
MSLSRVDLDPFGILLKVMRLVVARPVTQSLAQDLRQRENVVCFGASSPESVHTISHNNNMIPYNKIIAFMA